MGYLHIDNLYKCQEILMFKECYVLEKIHGTSAHISWKDNRVGFFAGGENHEMFKRIFNEVELSEKCKQIGLEKFVVYGEAYGGKCQGMRETYGDDLKFIAFDVKIEDLWLDVLKAHKFVESLGLEFVWFAKTTTDVDNLNSFRDRFSEQAVRNGLGEKVQEGVVIRSLIELKKNNNERIIVKHKTDKFSETKTKRTVSLEKMKILEGVNAICSEWITENRLTNILSHISKALDIKDIPMIIGRMTEDVLREADGEIVESSELKKAIARETAIMFKKRLNSNINKGGL